jgi:hypothetical protein
MNRSYAAISVFLVAAMAGLFCSSALAQEVYKWTDANGKVHYGDRSAAPESSKKMHIDAEPPRPPPIASSPATASQPRSALAPPRDGQKKSVPANPALVGPLCKGLIDKIAAVPPGKNWESLYAQFNSACPRIAYECTEYQSNPQNNQCIWIERTGGRVLHTNTYP